MIVVEEIKKKAYLHEISKKYLHDDEINCCLTMTRPQIDEQHKVKYAAHNAVHIHIDLKDQSDLDDLYNRYENLTGEKIKHKDSLNGYEVISSILGHNTYLTFCNSYPCNVHLDAKDNKYHQEFDVIVYVEEDFEIEKNTKGEEEKIKQMEQLKSNARLNNLFIKDIIMSKLNELEYDLSISQDRYIYFTKVKGWNKLIKDALEYYMNEKIFKDLKCKVVMSKIKNSHKYCYNDNLFDLGNVVIEK